jgi:hypothetical protein
MAGTLDTSKIIQVITTDATGAATGGSTAGGTTGGAAAINTAAATRVAGNDGANDRIIKTDINGVLSSVLPFNDTTSVLSSAATFTGTARDIGSAVGSSNYGYAFFNAYFFADQLGTAFIECSNDNSTWRVIATSAIAVSTPVILSVPVMTRYHRVRLLNGATLQGLVMVNSSYSAN